MFEFNNIIITSYKGFFRCHKSPFNCVELQSEMAVIINVIINNQYMNTLSIFNIIINKMKQQ